jgi:hypothetical protein
MTRYQRRVLSEQLTVRVEQRIARGWPPGRIAADLGVDELDVWWVLDRMDRINAIPDQPQHPQGLAQVCVAEAGCDALAREELAAIYSQNVPEHHTSRRPLPTKDTRWERGRLSSAARKLRDGAA